MTTQQCEECFDLFANASEYLSHKAMRHTLKEYQVNITITSYGQTTIEANSYEEALQLAQDLTAGDFDFIEGSDDEREVIVGA